VFRDLVSRCAPLSADQAAALEAHYELLCRWNKILNLTRIERLEDAVERHYCESLFLASHLPDSTSIIDVGSGPGFPGFVVAVVKPSCSVTLVESHQRKAVFLKEASRKLPNVHVQSVRAESLSASFDWMISRAVSYEDLSPIVPKIAPRVALLSGADAPPEVWPYSWSVLPLPNSKNRFLRLGEIVSRETDSPVCFT
jgi:16S rRNA (guanine527-N7)-methyltransferase